MQIHTLAAGKMDWSEFLAEYLQESGQRFSHFGLLVPTSPERVPPQRIAVLSAIKIMMEFTP